MSEVCIILSGIEFFMDSRGEVRGEDDKKKAAGEPPSSFRVLGERVHSQCVAPHEKWTAVYSYVDKCRLIGGQDFSVNRTGLLQ